MLGRIKSFFVCLVFLVSTNSVYAQADDSVYIQNSYTPGGYLYDGGGELRYGYPLEGDAAFKWLIADGYIQNVKSGLYITITGHGKSEGSFGDPVLLTEAPEAGTVWHFDDVSGEGSTAIFSGDPEYAGFALHLEGADSAAARAQKISAEQAEWGNMRWRFLKENEVNFDAILRSIAVQNGTAGDLILPDKPYNLKNSWTGLYILEFDGVPVYGNSGPHDKTAQWRMLYNEESGLTALVNEGTGHFVYPGGKGLVCGSTLSYYWKLRPNANDLYPDAVEFEDSENVNSFLHMETMNGKIENSSTVQPHWGTPHWVPEDPQSQPVSADKLSESLPEGYVRLISSTQTEWGLYANAAGAVLCGQVDEKDARSHWEFVRQGEIYILKNREFGTCVGSTGGASLRMYEPEKARGCAWRVQGDGKTYALLNVLPDTETFQMPLLTVNEKRNQVGAELVNPSAKNARWIVVPAPEAAAVREDENIDMTLLYELLAEAENGRGAQVSYTRYEAEDCETNAEELFRSTQYHTVQSEASGRSAVELSRTSHYISWTLTAPANALTVRYCVPDSDDDKGQDYTLSLFADDRPVAAIEMSSKQTWNYGAYPWTNIPEDGNPHNFFDEARIILPDEYPTGTVLTLKKGVHDYADSYIIDLIEAEVIPPPVPMPENALLLTDFGEGPGGLEMCIGEASLKGVPVYIPEGTYIIDHQHTIGRPVTIIGAGPWYTTLKNASFYIKGDGVKISGISFDGYANTRQDAADPAAIESGAVESLTLQSLWITHYKVGVWLNGANGAVLDNLRIRNTFADGVNFHSGVTDSIIKNCDFRSTGDDAIGLWSETAPNRNINIHHNTIALPWLGNAIGIYGGENITVSDNWICDTIYAGGGVNISTNFKPVPPSGTITVTRNTFERCGAENTGAAAGAIWFNTAAGFDNNALINVSRNIILDSIYAGISVENGGSLTDARVTENVVSGTGTYGLEIAASARGTLSVRGNLILGVALGAIQNSAGNKFTITELSAQPFVSHKDEPFGAKGAIAAGIIAVPALAGIFVTARGKRKNKANKKILKN